MPITKVNSLGIGNFPVGTSNVALGTGALIANTTGECNTAVGSLALDANTTASNNVAIGTNALGANTTGGANTAVGRSALTTNTTGADNTAVGLNSLLLNTTGCQNTALGKQALLSNTTGIDNIALGFASLCSNTTASDNIGIGRNALLVNTTGCENVSVGSGTLDANTTGIQSTALGHGSLSSNSTGCRNVGVGYLSLLCLTTGINNTAIGTTAGVTGLGPEGIVNLTTQCNRIVMGNNEHTCAQIKIAWTVTSDARDKTCIDVVPHGLCFVKQLNPISFFYKKSRNEEIASGNKRYGFKAQDILQLEQGDSVIKSDDEPEKLQYNESSLIPVLVNAIKELAAENNNLKSRVEALENKS